MLILTATLNCLSEIGEKSSTGDTKDVWVWAHICAPDGCPMARRLDTIPLQAARCSASV
jgi:hypothetical protein